VNYYAMKTCGEWRYSSTILDLGGGRRWAASFTFRPLYPRGKSPLFSLDRRLGGLQSKTGRWRVEKTSCPCRQLYIYENLITGEFEVIMGATVYFGESFYLVDRGIIRFTCTQLGLRVVVFRKNIVIYSLHLYIYSFFCIFWKSQTRKKDAAKLREKNYPHPSKSEIAVVNKISEETDLSGISTISYWLT
jgi:hypothetical protein